MEMMAPLWWTPDFLARFRRARGYDPIKYLPVFFQARNLWNVYGEPYDSVYVIEGEPSDGGKYAEDYRLTLTEGYQEYLKQHQKWAESRGMGHSTQPAYNMPLDMVRELPVVAGVLGVLIDSPVASPLLFPWFQDPSSSLSDLGNPSTPTANLQDQQTSSAVKLFLPRLERNAEEHTHKQSRRFSVCSEIHLPPVSTL